jgi:hypothetical protein
MHAAFLTGFAKLENAIPLRVTLLARFEKRQRSDFEFVSLGLADNLISQILPAGQSFD